ncbi:MAG: D-alanyl-D-alanine carboxypeptidase/D-alanyl-D-alanine-endopeptidase [Sulfurovum sp.]|nr:D-alanyl-D-alanine carboxypeptidase/D-alanyl-D-alanine-endopeptidase [Sulfurovum sp.]
MKFIFITFIFITINVYALPQAIESFIKKSTIPKKDMSIYIKEVGHKGKIVAAVNQNASKTPASVIKVMSTYAALLKLGFDYRFPTKFYTTGRLSNGILDGDIYIKGFGDPTLKSKDLVTISKELKAKGIKRITGNIIIDRSFFRVSSKNNSGFDEHTYSPYNAMPDAMMYNERISTICVIPKQNDVRKKEVDGSYQVINKIKAVNKPCKGRYSWTGFKINKNEVIPKVIVQGQISKHCGQQNICKVITKPYLSFYYALKETLKKQGITVDGNMRLRKVPQSAKLLYTHHSQPLEKIISTTAKKSNNLYARHLLLFLGAKIYGAPSTVSKGRRAVEHILKKNRALSGGLLSIDNGSGLSRTAKLSAKMLVNMLDAAYIKYGERWMDTLSIAGVDGTINKRFRGTVVKNRAWMKTGTLKRTKNIGGYVRSVTGQLYEVVILVQSRRGNWRASQLQNDILTWLVKYKG